MSKLPIRKLPKPSNLSQPPPIPLPDLPPSLSSLPQPTTSSHLLHLTTLLHRHLPTTTLTPPSLLHFLKTRIRHHPTLHHLDLHLFRYAATLDSFRHDHTTFHYLTLTLISTHRLDSLPWLLNFISSNPCPCSDGIFTCSHIHPIFLSSIAALSRNGKFNDAVAAFNIVKKLVDGKVGVEVYNVVINGFVKGGEMDKGLGFYNRMLEDWVRPDTATFNILISGFCRNGRFREALEVFNEMREKGCVPNVVSFNTLIRGFFRDGEVGRAVGMAREMVELECGVSCATCEIVVDGLCKVGKVGEAGGLIVEFLRKGVLPKGYECLGLVERLCEEGKAGKGLELVDELWGKGYVPGLIACTTLIEGLRGVGRVGEAVELVRRMIEGGIVPDSVTFSCLLEDMCGKGRAVEANKLRMLAEKKGLEADGMMYRILISGYSREGRRKEGEFLVDEMLDRGFIHDIATYNRFMDGLAKSKARIG